MYHVYKDGYSTLPNLKKIQKDKIFEFNRKESSYLQVEKKEALENQKYFFEYDNDPVFYEIATDFILKNYPIKLSSNNYTEIAKEIDEDLLIHRIKGNSDFLSSAHVCFPSGWLPEDKIGKSFREIHAPVPMNLNNSEKLVNAIINGGNFERFVWSLVFEKKYNFHPRFYFNSFNSESPKLFVKIERQVTVGFPKYSFCLFILRQYLIEEEELDKKCLYESIIKMDSNQKKYKQIENFENIIKYLTL